VTTVYDLGDGVALEHTVYDRTGALTAATVAITVTKPSGATVSPSVTTPSTGVYRAASFTTDQTGLWYGAWSVSGSVVDVVPFAFTVANPGPAAYADFEAVKAALGKDSVDGRDDLIRMAILAASRWIDRRTGRRFYPDTTTSTHTVPIAGRARCEDGYQVLLVPDMADAEDLVVETGSPTAGWTAVTGLEAAASDAVTDPNPPLTLIRGPLGWLPPYGRARITTRWGCPAAPDEIVQAANLLSVRLYRRKDSPQGVLGSAEWGQIRVARADPDVEALIAPYCIPLIA
jgi:hypothetical protein